MAVLCEAISVIIKVQSIDNFYQGGQEEFKLHIPNSTICSDGELVRVGFMSPQETREYVDELLLSGLQYAPEEFCIETPTGIFSMLDEIRDFDDIIVVDQQKGPMRECSWIEFGHLPINQTGETIAACWLFEGERRGFGLHMSAKDAEEGIEIALPEDWSYENSLSKKFTFKEIEL